MAIRLFSPGEVAAAAAADSTGTRMLRSHVLLRAAFAKARVNAAIARAERPASSVVLLGAGCDTLFYNAPPTWSDLTLLEVDQPASQRAKRARLAAGFVGIPLNVRFLPVDFAATPLSTALEGVLPADKPAVFIWLGVMMYLDASAIDAVLAYVASCPRGTELVFSFAPSGAFSAAAFSDNENGTSGKGGGNSGVEAQAAAMGEPWLSKHSPAEIEALLRRHGFTDVHFLAGDEAASYFGAAERADGLCASSRISIGAAVV